MNKTEPRNEAPDAKLPPPRHSVWHTLGLRLLILLLVAEAPLVFFTCALALQNEHLRAQDALSQAASAQRLLLTELDRNMRTAMSLADAAAALPAEVLADQNGCGAVLHLLIAAESDRIQAATIERADRTIICNSNEDGAPHAPHPAPDIVLPSLWPDSLVAEPGGIYVLHPLIDAGRLLGAIYIKLAPLQATEDSRPHSPPPCLWLGYAITWQPLDCRQATAAPAEIVTAAIPTRARSLDNRPFLYTTAPLPSTLGPAGATVLAGSDIRAASSASSRWFAFRAAEIIGFFLAEFVLIVAGISVVVTTPLKRLNDAVRHWRGGGVFGDGSQANDPQELKELGDSFFKATRSLNAREQELRTAIQQQDALMREIHHRVKNNLQIIASLLNLQASRIKAPEARAEFQSARDRVRALATLHRHLYAEGELHSIDMRAFFSELCGHQFQSMNEAEGNRIALQITAPDVRLSSDQAVPIALIVTETVSNALRYAFPANARGAIRVEMTVGPDQQATLTVQDDGVGLAEPPERGAAGLGLQLVRGFAKQLGAVLTVSSEHGTCYRLDMKLHLHHAEDRAVRASPRVAPVP